MKNLLAFVLLFNCLLGSLKSQQTLTQINGWNAYVHLPANYNSTSTKYPTIIFFPGLGEIGTNASAVIANGPGAYIAQGWNGNVVVDGNTVEFIVISLQTPTAYPREPQIDQKIQTIKTLYRVDPNRLYLTGLSHGGWCSNTYVTGDIYGGPYTYASQIAAVVEVEGVIPSDNKPYPDMFDNFALSGGKLLGFEQRNDNRSMPSRVNRMNATVPNSAIYIQTNFGGGGHCCWEQFYGGRGTQPGVFSLGGVNQNLYQWLARQSRGSSALPKPPANQAPTANAGNDISITLPINTVTLNGTGSDPDGTIKTYSWTKLSGGAANIANASAASVTITGLVAGTYQFQLTVTDNGGASATDVVNVTVKAAVSNAAPVVNAGSSQSITLPLNSITLVGTASDPDGTIATILWSKLSGPTGGTIASPSTLSTTVNGLTQGSYAFQLAATDNKGATANSTVNITVNATGTISRAVKVNVYGGANPCKNGEWNNWNVISSPNSSALKYSDGTASTISVNLSSSQGIGDNGASYASGIALSEVLRYASYSTVNRTLTINGLAKDKTYNLELYASRSSNLESASIFVVNQQTITVSSFNNTSTKASFNAVSTTAQGQIVVSIRRLTSDGFNYLNGFLITENSGSASATARTLTTDIADTSFTVDKLSTEAVSKAFYILPNPVNDRFTLEIRNSHTGMMNVQIVNQLGTVEKTLVFRKDQNMTQVNIPVVGLKSGIYFVRVQVGSWTETKKIIKL